jgi:spore coat protein U-like protein
MQNQLFQRQIPGAIVIAAMAHPGGAAVYGNGRKNATFDMTLNIIADCAVAASPLDFGQSQGVLSRVITASSGINVICSNSTPYNVGLTADTGLSGTTRYLSGTGQNAGAGSGTAQTLTVHGAIPAQATPAPDNDKSAVTATNYF